MPVWDRFLTDRDKALREVFGSKRMGFGKRPVVMVIDVSEAFTGDKDEPILDSVKRFRNSCGSEGWRAAGQIGVLLDHARAKGLPVIYTAEMDLREDGWDSGRWTDKNARATEMRTHDLGAGMDAITAKPGYRLRRGARINPRIEPQVGDIMVGKTKPSAFFGTFLTSFLVDLQADTVILAGSTTGGCVRATTIDGFSYNYRMALVEECVFDRFELSHAATLFDIEMKYGDVVPLAETLAYVDSLPDGLFDEQMPTLRRRPEAATR
jgi:maleamate amidohydrolase